MNVFAVQLLAYAYFLYGGIDLPENEYISRKKTIQFHIWFAQPKSRVEKDPHLCLLLSNEQF